MMLPRFAIDREQGARFAAAIPDALINGHEIAIDGDDTLTLARGFACGMLGALADRHVDTVRCRRINADDLAGLRAAGRRHHVRIVHEG
jgi:hypothetical protein